MKISRARLKQIIKEELGMLVGEEDPQMDKNWEEPLMDRNSNLIYLIKQHRKAWLNRHWNDEAIEEDLSGAYLELIYNISTFWKSSNVRIVYTGQETQLAAAISVIDKIIDRAEKRKIRTALKDIGLIVPVRKEPSALADTKLGKRLGLKAYGGDGPSAPPDEDDDL